ncbi:MAG: hypothetical protein ACI965_000546 [Paraglaciecola sp.]|jgi:hypothetical protein
MLRNIILILGLYWGASAMGQTIPLIEQYVPKAQLVGQARLKVLFWNVYDAKLYAAAGVWSSEMPFALSLKYLRDLDGADIAKRSIDEIRQQGFDDEQAMARWYDTLLKIIPDVSDASTIIGLRNAEGGTILYHNNQLIGEVAEPLFGRWFFNIWLGEKTSEPKLRSKLLGE